MFSSEREDHYLVTTRKRKLRKSQKAKALSYMVSRKDLTPAQERRLHHKEGSRKTHSHDRNVVPEGQKFRCLRCMPPAARKVPVKAAAGPRDWTPPGADLS